MNPLVKRLTESAEQKLPIIVDTRPQEFWRCPHCQQEIFEKHTYVDESGVEHHSDCKGALELPATDWSKVSPEWQFLKSYVKESFHGITFFEGCGHTNRCRCSCTDKRSVPGKCFSCQLKENDT